ncbi:MAG: hypothetical protein K8R41_05325 [Bacteroidales bacterium]|nr:hypothetical protein [Bacteroidales bacterium]
MIKKLFLFLLIVLMSILCLYSQQDNNSLKEQRDAYYKDYKLCKDTMTVRTWINLVNLVEHLENVVKIDNTIINNIDEKDDNKEPGLTKAEKKLMEARQTLDQLIIQNNKIKDDKDSAQKRLYTVAVIAGLILIFLIIFLIMNITLKSKYKKLENDFKYTNDELLKAKDINTINENDVRSKIEKAEQEKELIENNLQEVKKAFEALKVQIDTPSGTEQGIDRETYQELAEEFNILKSEINNIIAEKQDMEASVKELNIKYAQELESKKQMENELKAMLERLGIYD